MFLPGHRLALAQGPEQAAHLGGSPLTAKEAPHRGTRFFGTPAERRFGAVVRPMRLPSIVSPARKIRLIGANAQRKKPETS